jgi:RimJ/RimL family protein N-acetyltransferase
MTNRHLILVRPRKTMCPMSNTTSSVVDSGALFLRHLTLDDTAAMFRLSQEQGMRAWLPNQVYANEAHAFEVLRFLSSQYSPSANPRHTPYVLGVCLSASRELIGHVGFSPCEYGVEVGYAIGDAHQNRGYAKQAVFAATRWALSRFDLPFIHAIVAEENAGSWKVVESCGFQLLAVIQRKLHGVERPVRIYRLSNATCRET